MVPLLGNLGLKVEEDLQVPGAPSSALPLRPGVAGALPVRVAWLVPESLVPPGSFSKQNPETL